MAGIPVRAQDRVVLYSAQFRDMARDLVLRAASVQVHDSDYAALTRLRQDLAASSRAQIAGTVFPEAEPAFDKALIISPKGRDFARAQIWSAYHSLLEGGELYLIGANDEGIKSVIADAGTLFGRARTLTYKQRHRLGAAQKFEAGASFPAAWGDVPTRIQTRTLDTPLGSIPLGTMPGVFSWQALDDGTAFLLSQALLPGLAEGADVLDVGCGTGVIGCALGRRARSLHLVDVNLLAVECARTSVQLNDLPDARVYPSDVYSDVEGSFDLIVSNPPFHQGFDVSSEAVSRLMAQAPDHLKPGGRLLIVANAFLPYEAALEEHLGNAQVVAQNTRYKVLMGEKR
jgi:16S rRNA (guanine1207-N2)-methyltransferase